MLVAPTEGRYGAREPREGCFFYLPPGEIRESPAKEAAFEIGFQQQEGLEQGARCPGEEGNALRIQTESGLSLSPHRTAWPPF